MHWNQQPSGICQESTTDEYSKVDGVKSDNKVFRCNEATEDDRLHCKRQLPATAADMPDIEEERQDPLMVDPIQCIESGESLLLLGRPGTGKSTLTCKLVKMLEASGQQVVCAAKTMWPRVAYRMVFRSITLSAQKLKEAGIHNGLSWKKFQ